jgi:Protein of unknown function (DUF2380)
VQASNLQACGGCDMRFAQRIGAELAITGTVQKQSALATDKIAPLLIGSDVRPDWSPQTERSSFR